MPDDVLTLQVTEDFSTAKDVTARKPWACEWCGQIEQPGSQCRVISGAWEGHMFRVRLHPECAAADREYMAKHKLWPEDRPEPGSMVRGKPLPKDEACEDCGVEQWTTWSLDETRGLCAACALAEEQRSLQKGGEG